MHLEVIISILVTHLSHCSCFLRNHLGESVLFTTTKSCHVDARVADAPTSWVRLLPKFELLLLQLGVGFYVIAEFSIAGEDEFLERLYSCILEFEETVEVLVHVTNLFDFEVAPAIK